MNILVVEDEVLILNDTLDILAELNFIATGVYSGEDAILKVKNAKIDLVIMDINLSDKNSNNLNGIEAVKIIKQINENVNIVYATSSCDEKTINEAIATSPDSYLIKPYSKNDLSIALKIIQNKTNIQENDSVKYFSNKQFSYDMVAKKLYHNGIYIKLPKREIKLLELVLENLDKKIVTNDQIDYHIWDNNSVNETTRRVLISRLNSKFNHLLFENKKGVGYIILL